MTAKDALRQIADAVRQDGAEAARASLVAFMERHPADLTSGHYAAALLLGLPADAVPVRAEDLMPLLQQPERFDLPRLASLITQIAAAPATEGPRIELGCLLVEAGEAHWAEQCLLRVHDRRATPPLQRVASGVFMVLNRRERALLAARAAADGDPAVAEYHIHHAGLLLAGNEPGLALLAAGRALGIEPDNAIAWRMASSAYLSLGLAAEAIDASRRAAALSETQASFAEEVVVSAAAEALRRGAAAADVPAKHRVRRQRPAWAEMRPMPKGPPTRLRDFVRARLRLLDALMLREARGLFTHSRLGYAWALFEPLTHVFILTVAMIFLAGQQTLPVIGDNMPEFYMTGVLPYLMFCHLTERGLDIARSQRVVLTLPGVQVGDVLLSCLLLRAATDSFVMVISIAVFMALGIGSLPQDLLEFALVYVLLFLLAFGIASINLALSTLGSIPERVWPIILRAAYFLSGIFYHPSAMPAELRDLVLWNPLVHVIEWARQAYYPLYRSPYLDLDYLFGSTVLALLVGTLAAASVSRRVRLLR